MCYTYDRLSGVTFTKAQMLREIQYHNRVQEILLPLSDVGYIQPLIKSVAHVDFESDKNFKTYLKMYIGNQLWYEN